MPKLDRFFAFFVQLISLQLQFFPLQMLQRANELIMAGSPGLVVMGGDTNQKVVGSNPSTGNWIGISTNCIFC